MTLVGNLTWEATPELRVTPAGAVARFAPPAGPAAPHLSPAELEAFLTARGIQAGIVSPGDLLAGQNHAGEGTPGMGIHGKPIPTPRGGDWPLTAGDNVVVSAGGKSIRPTAKGFFLGKDGRISGGVVNVAESSVDFRTGNPTYDGDIVNRGAVMDGFKVEAGGDHLVGRDVQGAVLASAGGGITMKGAVFAQERARPEAKLDIAAGTAQRARIPCRNLEVGKSLLDCRVEAQVVEATGDAGLVIGGNVRSFGPVRVRAERGRPEARGRVVEEERQALDRKPKAFKSIRQKSSTGRASPKAAEELQARDGRDAGLDA